jgi:predicted phosphodiesterase
MNGLFFATKAFVKIGILSDIHGNLEALEAVLAELDHENVERVLCLGDVVGYGPDPNACLDRVMETMDVVLAGNHDHGTVGLTPIHAFNDNARQAVEWTRTVIREDLAEVLSGLQLVHEEGLLLALHATPAEPAKWHYLMSETEIETNLAAMTLPLCFVGHSHLPLAFVQGSEGGITVRSAESIRFESGCKYLINVGSVGQPRDGDPRAAFGVLEDSGFRLNRVEYDIPSVQNKMRSFGLPVRLIDRLSQGL